MGALLVELGFIDEGQLESALEEQELSGKRLGRILVDASVITEDRLVHALSRQLGIETCDPVLANVHERVLGMVPSSLAHEHRVLPVALRKEDTGDVLFVATSDPLNKVALNAIREINGSRRVRWLLASETEMEAALARHYGQVPSTPPARKSNPTPLPEGTPVITGTPLSAPKNATPPQGMAPPPMAGGPPPAQNAFSHGLTDDNEALDLGLEEQPSAAEIYAPMAPSEVASSAPPAPAAEPDPFAALAAGMDLPGELPPIDVPPEFLTSPDAALRLIESETGEIAASDLPEVSQSLPELGTADMQPIEDEAPIPLPMEALQLMEEPEEAPPAPANGHAKEAPFSSPSPEPSPPERKPSSSVPASSSSIPASGMSWGDLVGGDLDLGLTPEPISAMPPPPAEPEEATAEAPEDGAPSEAEPEPEPECLELEPLVPEAETPERPGVEPVELEAVAEPEELELESIAPGTASAEPTPAEPAEPEAAEPVEPEAAEPEVTASSSSDRPDVIEDLGAASRAALNGAAAPTPFEGPTNYGDLDEAQEAEEADDLPDATDDVLPTSDPRVEILELEQEEAQEEDQDVETIAEPRAAIGTANGEIQLTRAQSLRDVMLRFVDDGVLEEDPHFVMRLMATIMENEGLLEEKKIAAALELIEKD